MFPMGSISSAFLIVVLMNPNPLRKQTGRRLMQMLLPSCGETLMGRTPLGGVLQAFPIDSGSLQFFMSTTTPDDRSMRRHRKAVIRLSPFRMSFSLWSLTSAMVLAFPMLRASSLPLVLASRSRQCLEEKETLVFQ